MALKSTVIRARVQLSDMDRHVYETLSLTLAQHPSETELRLMTRLLAYCICYEERLEFTKGLSDDDEPEVWKKSFSDEIEHWIDLGNPDADRVKKASGRSQKVSVFSYANSADVWWQKNQVNFTKAKKVTFWRFDPAEIEQTVAMCSRQMDLTLSISEGSLFLSDADRSFELSPKLWTDFA